MPTKDKAHAANSCLPFVLATVLFAATAACGPSATLYEIDGSTAAAISTPTDGDSTQNPKADPASPIAGLKQGGSGWLGDVNVAATSKQYEGMTLDQLKASGSSLAQALAMHPDVERAIRQVAAESGVPAGLLAGLCYQESSFEPGAVSNNPNPTPDDPRDVGITQAPEPAFEKDSWRDPLVNLRVFVKQYFLPDYKRYGNWGEPLRIWNSGEVDDPNDLRLEHNNTDPNYITEILGTHCMGLN